MQTVIGRTMWYDRIPTAQDKATQADYAAWLETLPLQIYVTLTFAHRVSQPQGTATFKEFINRLERHYRVPIGWVRCEEVIGWSGCGLAATELHYHVLLCSSARLDPTVIESVWHALGHFKDNADARVYEETGNAAAYCMKFLHQPGQQWDHGNLHFFVKGSAQGNHHRRRQQSRQQARIPQCAEV
jgi:hypothetical protein